MDGQATPAQIGALLTAFHIKGETVSEISGAARKRFLAELVFFERGLGVGSTDGPLESAKIRCPRGHWFNGPVEALSTPESRQTRPVRSVNGWVLSGTGPRYEQ